ncbi:MAG: hypothetical protein ACYC1T_06315 [Sulfuricaulis sp.]
MEQAHAISMKTVSKGSGDKVHVACYGRQNLASIPADDVDCRIPLTTF